MAEKSLFPRVHRSLHLPTADPCFPQVFRDAVTRAIFQLLGPYKAKELH